MYETANGAPHYLPRSLYDRFELTHFLAYLRNGTGLGNIVSCMDCASTTTTFSNLVGCAAGEYWRRMRRGRATWPREASARISGRARSRADPPRKAHFLDSAKLSYSPAQPPAPQTVCNFGVLSATYPFLWSGSKDLGRWPEGRCLLEATPRPRAVLHSRRPAQCAVQGAQSSVQRPRTSRLSSGSRGLVPLVATPLHCLRCTYRETTIPG